jgi:tripartite-type tricarboxylate transporter receptor subunit TctC
LSGVLRFGQGRYVILSTREQSQFQAQLRQSGYRPVASGNLEAKMRKLTILIAGILVAVTTTTMAQVPQSGPIKLIVPFAPGGSSDTVARLIAGPLGEALQRTVVVENRSGAGGAIGTEFVARSPADGNTLLVAFDSHTILPVLNKNLNYDTERDFAPISQLTSAPLVVTVNPKVPAHTISELVAYAKRTPGGLSFGSVPDSSPHLAGLLFKLATGAPLVHIPYRGGAPAVTDLLAGQIQLMFAGPQVVSQFISGGTLHGIAVTANQRFALMPDLPTVSESGYADVNVSTWVGLLAPAKTPEPVLQRYEAEVRKIIQSPDMVSRLHALKLNVVSSSAKDFDTFISDDIARWRRVVNESKLTVH